MTEQSDDRTQTEPDNVAPAWNDFPETELDRPPLYGAEQSAYRDGPRDGEPVTDYDSKTVMLQAQRRDEISITEIVERYPVEAEIPDMVSVIERAATYFGPELKLHAEHDGEDYNYLLTAPGPDAFLVLHAAETEVNADGRKLRSGWYPAAEVKAYLHEPDNKYRRCDVCRQPTETIQHERESLFGICTRDEVER